MANENEYIQGTSVAVTDETIQVTRQFLKEHLEEIKTKNSIRDKDGSTGGTKGYNKTPEAFQIAEFLGWGETRIYESLQRIEMEERDELDKESIESLLMEKAATKCILAGYRIFDILRGNK